MFCFLFLLEKTTKKCYKTCGPNQRYFSVTSLLWLGIFQKKLIISSFLGFQMLVWLGIFQPICLFKISGKKHMFGTNWGWSTQKWMTKQTFIVIT